MVTKYLRDNTLQLGLVLILMAAVTVVFDVHVLSSIILVGLLAGAVVLAKTIGAGNASLVYVTLLILLMLGGYGFMRIQERPVDSYEKLPQIIQDVLEDILQIIDKSMDATGLDEAASKITETAGKIVGYGEDLYYVIYYTLYFLALGTITMLLITPPGQALTSLAVLGGVAITAGSYLWGLT